MSHVPRHATTYIIDVHGGEAVHLIAQVLVGRGHAVVGTDPGAGRVVGLDLGPYPSDDEQWWMAAEERFVSGLAEAHGGRLMRSQALPATARRLLARCDIVADRTVEEARDQRMVALSREPSRVPAPVIVHRLRVPEPSTGPTGEPVTLDGFDDVDRASLSHAYGSAEDVPDLLLRLAANDEGWDEAMQDYWDAVVHQGTCYDSTPPTIGPLGLSDFRAFRRGIEGPSPTLDLALALITGEDDPTFGAAAWDERVAGMLNASEPLRRRRLKVLIHLATAELAS